MSVFDDQGHVHLTDPPVMWEALAELVGDNAEHWRGGVTCWPEGDDASGPANWRIELNDWQGNQVGASKGDHLVFVFGKLIMVTDE